MRWSGLALRAGLDSDAKHQKPSREYAIGVDRKARYSQFDLTWIIECAFQGGLYAVSIRLLLRCGDGDEQENKTRRRLEDDEI